MLRFFRLWKVSGQDVRLLWFALSHPERPAWLLPVSAVLAFYALDPLNFAIPLLGIFDDLVMLPLLLHALVKFLPPGIRFGFENRRATLVR